MTSALSLARAAGIGAGGVAGGVAGGAFAIPASSGSGSPGPKAYGPEKPEPGKAHDAEERVGADDDTRPDAADSAKAEKTEGDEDQTPEEAAVAAEKAAMLAMAAAAAAQPLTIHTLNGMLLTVPATPLGGHAAAQSGGPGKGRGAAPTPGPSGGSGVQGGITAQLSEGPAGGAQNVGRASPSPGAGSAQPQSGAAPQDHREGALALERTAGRSPKSAPEPRSERVTPAQNVPALGTQPAPAPSERGAANSSAGVAVRGVIGRAVGLGEAGASRKGGATDRAHVPTDRTGPAQVVRGMMAAVNQRGGKVTLDLEPNELGRMRVELKLDARSATATFRVDSPEARRLLEDALPLLRQALTDRGLTLERAEVVAPPANAELAGALAAMQAGTHTVAFVSAEELDLGDDRKRGDADQRDAETDGPTEAGRRGEPGDSGEAAGERQSLVIGPDGVDVIA